MVLRAHDYRVHTVVDEEGDWLSLECFELQYPHRLVGRPIEDVSIDVPPGCVLIAVDVHIGYAVTDTESRRLEPRLCAAHGIDNLRVNPSCISRRCCFCQRSCTRFR